MSEQTLSEAFRSNLESCMEDKHMTASDLARVLECRPSMVSNYRYGGRCPTLNQVEKFAWALDVSPLRLLTIKKRD